MGAKDNAVVLGKKVRSFKQDLLPKRIPGVPEGGLVPITVYSCTLETDRLKVEATTEK